ncbi:hypothetical protein [Sphingomonas bacterium]|uniref:hypothetical protein n=1 Tax=Sphingomonas bacterium TaxID=1895847 RepID=UPI0015754841|nr:hypothetical protein [Sphingomonas bacterium]
MPALDPDTTPVGRQPAAYLVTPSKSQPWIGGVIGAAIVAGVVVGGERYTAQQQAEGRRRGVDLIDGPSLLVKRQATAEEMWWPAATLPPVFAFECPVIGKRGDRITIIAPNGDGKLVQADGWAHRPYRKPRDVWGAAA